MLPARNFRHLSEAVDINYSPRDGAAVSNLPRKHCELSSWRPSGAITDISQLGIVTQNARFSKGPTDLYIGSRGKISFYVQIGRKLG